jgi:hypothetical protein
MAEFKGIVVHAVQFAQANFDEIETFVGGDAESRGGRMVVATREGPLWASPNDWIVKVDGRFIAFPPDIFAVIFQPLDG